MINRQPIIQGLSIVFVGDFNPKIFQPAWFSANNLIREKEAEDAKIEIVHPTIVVFKLDWLNVQITSDQFLMLTTQEPYYEVLRDLVLGTFRLLVHTPIRMMGININMHFQMGSTKEWHKFGNMLTPKEPWTDILKNPGMRSVIMEGSVQRDKLKGYIRVKVEPSTEVPDGVYFNINDHFEVTDPKTVIGCEDIINILEQSFDESRKRAAGIIYSLLDKK